jgi:5'-methylthioadenosine phosphorylase
VNPTLFDDARSHTIPGFDRGWRAQVLDTWRAHAATPIVDGGVYVQSRGPRFETAAEVRALARIGDLVGMTIAAECILCREASLPYAAVCVVDNLANGLDAAPLTVEQFQAAVLANRTALLDDLATVLPALGASSAASAS